MPFFEEALREQSAPIRWYNLALAYRGAGRSAAACGAFERYLAAPEAGADEARLAAVRDEVATLLRSVARVRLTVTPEFASVRVDGREATTIAGDMRLDPGTHVLELEAPSWEPLRREVSVRAGETHAIELQLRPATLPPAPRAAVAPPVIAPVVPVRDVLAAPERPQPRRGWVLPVALTGGAMVVAGVVVAVLFATRPQADPTAGSWTTVREP